MYGMFESLTKAAVAVVAVPVAAVADIVTLPVSAENNTDPFARTTDMLGKVGENFNNAINPEDGKK